MGSTSEENTPLQKAEGRARADKNAIQQIKNEIMK